MTTTKPNHLENLSIIQVDFDIWSGQARLSPSDIKLGIGGEIPPEKVAQLGSKKICDPSKLKGFNRLKTETRRLLLKYGMPFMNGFAVPVKRTDEIIARLDSISLQFNQMKLDFVNNYNLAVNEWCYENPEYASAIRAGAISKEKVEDRIGFEYQVFMIQPVGDSEGNVSRLNRKVERLGNDLIDEVVQEANKFYLERLAGRDQCAVTTKQTLRNIRDKVDGLSFLNSAFSPLVSLLDQTILGYGTNSEGRNIVAPFFYQVMASVLIMCEKDRIEQYANGAITVESVTDNCIQTLGITTAPVINVQPQSSESKAADILQQLELSSDSEEPANTEVKSKIPEDLQDDIDSFFNSFMPKENDSANAEETDLDTNTEDCANDTPTVDTPTVLETPAVVVMQEQALVAAPVAHQPPVNDDDDDMFFP